jgi:hypothetical protein
MEKLINEIINDNTYTPKTIAWKLLLDDDTSILSSELCVFDPDTLTDDDPHSYLFEILITIFMEMIYDSAILMTATEKGDIESFNPDLSKFDINLFLPIIKSKLEKINILIQIHDFSIHDDIQYILNNRYCRVLLKHDKKSNYFFKNNNIEENYHMVLNYDFIKTNSLKSIYAIININDIIYQIYFDKII